MVEIDAVVGRDNIRPLKRSEYDRLVELGAFGDERLELLRGMLVARSPQGSRHAEAVRRLTRILLQALGERATVGPQVPFAALPDSEPEPDLSVVPPGDYSDHHPSQALLIIEVADESLRKDRSVKAPIYAENGVADYWIVNLRSNVIEAYRAPVEGVYTSVTTYAPAARIPLLAFPEIGIAVAEVIPR
jgi:Uma2 family endonuclease